MQIRTNTVSGTTTATQARMSLPTNATSLSTIPADRWVVGHGFLAVSSGTGFLNHAFVMVDPSQTYVVFGNPSTNSYGSANGNSFTSSTFLPMDLLVPINEWQP